MSESTAMSVEEVAAMLGVSTKTVYEAAGRGEIPHRRLGRRILFSRAAITKWFDGLPGEESLPGTSEAWQ